MKYELTKHWLELEFENKTLYQIRALKDFADVKKGDYGGYIENISNLSQEGNCWVYGDAQVFGNAMICGNARVYFYARVCDNAMIFGNAEVSGVAKVSGFAKVFDNAQIAGKSRVFDNAQVCGKSKVFDNAIICGDALIDNDAEVYGNNIVKKDDVIYNVNSKEQSKYYDLTIQPIDYIMANKLNFVEGNVIKYVSRYKQKNDKEDLLKAKYYLDLLIKEMGE